MNKVRGERSDCRSEIPASPTPLVWPGPTPAICPLTSDLVFVIQSPRARRRQIRIWIPDRGAVGRWHYSRRLPLAPSESDYDRARLPARYPGYLRFLGLAASCFHVGDRHSCFQLFFPASNRHLYHRRTAELDRPLRLSGHRGHGQRTVGARQARNALCRRAPAGTGTPLRLQPVAAFERQPGRVVELDSPLHRRVLWYPVVGDFVVESQRRLPFWPHHRRIGIARSAIDLLAR